MTRLFTPRPYQSLIIDHIAAHPRCAIWAGMGLGKTSSTLTALDLLSALEDVFPVLVIAPKRVARSTWPSEVTKWQHLSGLRTSVMVGDPAERRAALRAKAEIYTINYDNLPWLIDELDKAWPFRTIVADEATRLKSFRGSFQVSKNGKTFYRGDGGIRARALGRTAHRTPRFIGLSGTPAPNGLRDLWGQMWFVDAGRRLGRTYGGFEQRWFQTAYDGTVKPLDFAQDEIQSRVRDVCLSLRTKDWLPVQEPNLVPVYVDLPRKARQIYQDMEREMYVRLESGEVEAFGRASADMKCAQIASGALYVDDKATTWEVLHDEKLDALESIAEESAGAPLLVSYNFRHELARILKRFPDARELDEDPKTEADWNAGKIPMLVAHPKSAGHGLNLQDGGHNLVYFGWDWDLEGHEQILERIGPARQLQSGYDRVVNVYYILARRTTDEQRLARHRTKASVQSLLMEATARYGA